MNKFIFFSFFLNVIVLFAQKTMVLGSSGIKVSVNAEATSSTLGLIQLSGDLSGTAITPTINNNAVLSKTLTGLNSAISGTIGVSDTVLGAFGKLQNQINDKTVIVNVLTSGSGNLTVPSGRTVCKVTLVGGGGGGGGNPTYGGVGGGGAGGYLIGYLNIIPGTISIPYSVGIGGIGGTSYSIGGDGGDTWFGSASTTSIQLYGEGGGGGYDGSGSEGLYGSGRGGYSYGGFLNIYGQKGQPGQSPLISSPSTRLNISGFGGASPFGGAGYGGGIISNSTSNPGYDAVGYGSGGGGGTGNGGARAPGGNGRGGIIIVEWL